MYRTGRHNRKELIYWQVGEEKSGDDQLRFVIVRGPIDGDMLVEALNASMTLENMERDE